MSQARFDNWAPSAGGTAVSMAGGLAKAWVKFNGTGTVAINDSQNYSSLTDNGAGKYSLTFINGMANADYALSGAAGAQPSAGHRIFSSGVGASSFPPNSTTAGHRILLAFGQNNSSYDADEVMSAIHGDLA